MSAAAPPTRSSWLAFAGLAQVVGVALLPKCPLCLAMDFGILGSLLGAFQQRFGPLLWPSLALAAASGVALFLRLRTRPASRRVRPCCAAEPL
jgi:hypothetical protein